MAKSGHTLHPDICRSDTHELRVVVVACGGHGEAMCKSELSCRGWKCNHPADMWSVIADSPRSLRLPDLKTSPVISLATNKTTRVINLQCE